MKGTVRGRGAAARPGAGGATGAPAEALRLALLGGATLTLGDAPLRGFISTKAQALLCYLAVTGRQHGREALAGLLWGELPDESARNNLRQALANLRRLAGPHLAIAREAVAFNPEAPHWLDVARFEAHLREAAVTDRGAAAHLRAATELYGGDLLEGLAVRDAPAFEEWLAGERERLRQQALQALHDLAVHHTDRAEYTAASRALARLLALDPWREDAHRQLMTLLARSGQRDAALAQYETCRRVLLEGLGTPPAAATVALYEQLRAAPPDRPDPAPVPARPPAERRQLTLLDCALVGATALAEALDPEDLHELGAAWRHACAAVAARHAGRIVQERADGALLAFGFPLAHEDDAVRAVRAGLALVAAARSLDPPLPRGEGRPLAARAGIHTGLVVVGAGGGTGEGGAAREPHPDVSGLTPALAGRLQEGAPAGGVVLSGATARLIRGYFDLRALGERPLPGLPQPVAAYEVLAESGAHDRLDAAAKAAGGLTPLVGREEEVAALLAHWEAAGAGRGRAVLLTGEPGIGKSRLARVVWERAAAEGRPVLAAHCSPHARRSALAPLGEILRGLIGADPAAGPTAWLARLKAALAGAGLPRAALPALADLLAVPLPPGHTPTESAPQRRKERTFDALLALLRALAARGPALLLLEDLHWADPSTLELLGRLLDRPPDRLCALLTARPDFSPPWPPNAGPARLPLARLAPRQTELLVAQAAGERALPAAVVRHLAATAEGVPLFGEELARMVAEQVGLATPPDALAIPPTLRDTLTARLDQLGPAKVVAQAAAAIGREFPADLLAAVAPLDERGLRAALGRLEEADLVRRGAGAGPARYAFKHALIRDAAYESLLRRERQGYHRRIADWLAAHDRETVVARPELLAQHYTAAGHAARAVDHWLRAGRRALERSAHAEAIDHLTKGLLLLATLPDRPERARQELDFQLALGPALIAAQGYGAPAAARAYARARELARHLGVGAGLFPTLWGLWMTQQGQAQSAPARALAAELLALAEGSGDAALLLQARHAGWSTAFYRGELAAAAAHAAAGLARYDRRRDHPQAGLYGGHDAAVCSLSYAATTSWLLGYPERALAQLQDALALARRLAHPFSLASALEHAARVRQFRRDAPAVREQAEALVALARAQGFAYALALGTVLRGWAVAEGGAGDAGLAEMGAGLDAYRATGLQEGLPYLLGLLAEARRQRGQTAEALRLLDEAEALAGATEEAWWRAELQRVRGEVLLARPGGRHPQGYAAAAACFHRALAIARGQEARSLELRAAASLGRLWQEQGKTAEARALLAPLYSRFTEGLDTPDLAEARVLLDAPG